MTEPRDIPKIRRLLEQAHAMCTGTIGFPSLARLVADAVAHARTLEEDHAKAMEEREEAESEDAIRGRQDVFNGRQSHR